MRNIFLSLLLANLLFLAWKYLAAPAEVPAGQLLGRGSEPELVAATSRGPAPPPTGETILAGGDGAKCLKLGPIGDGQVADTLRSSLAARGIQSTALSREGQVWVGHWVQLDSVASREEADSMAARLAAGGLSDAYVLQTSPPFSISLGVYRDRDRADKVAAEARRLGFRPRIADRYRAGLQHWLLVVIPPGGELSMDQLGRESGQILRAEPASCAVEPDGGGRAD